MLLSPLRFGPSCHEFELTNVFSLTNPPQPWPHCSEHPRTLRTPSTEPSYPLDAPRTFNREFRAFKRRYRNSPRARQWRRREAVIPTCSPPFLFALSCSPHRAGHPGSLLFVWRGRERDSGELRGAHLVGGNGTTAVGPGLGESPPPFLLGPFDLISAAQITYPFGVM